MSDTNTTETIIQQVEARKKEEAARLAESAPDHNKEITSKLVERCLFANELGDGLLFAAMHCDQFIFNKSAGEWFVWAGHFWERDEMDAAAAAVENTARRYLDEASRLVDEIVKAKKNGASGAAELKNLQGLLYNRVARLRKNHGREQCLKMAHTNNQNALAIKGDIFDTQPWLLACRNGVIDLRTGKLRTGRPDDYISKACAVEYLDIDHPAPLWENTLLEIFNGDQELVDFIRRLFGYAITGLRTEHVFPILWGIGRNGKSTIIEVVSHVLGPLAGPIQSEMLLDQWRPKGSTGPSPDIMALKGLRMAFASESDEGRRISPSRVKWLTGGDTLVGRNPYDKYEVKFIPTHTLFLLTNEKPQPPQDDFAFWERAALIPFELSFVDRDPKGKFERRADKNLREKLEKEDPGILAWLVRGCIEWQEQGLNPPLMVIEATKQYRRDEDLIQDFTDECGFLDPAAEEQASKLYAVFKAWYQKNVSKKGISQKRFGRMMSKRFKREKHGTYVYYGISLLCDEELNPIS
jgi:putative DNA primase/helicase